MNLNNEYNYTFDYISLAVVIFNIYSRTSIHNVFLKDLYKIKEINTIYNIIYVYNIMVKKLTVEDSTQPDVYRLHDVYKRNIYIPVIDKYFEDKATINKNTMLLYLRSYCESEHEMLYDPSLLLDVLIEMMCYDYRNRRIDINKLKTALCM